MTAVATKEKPAAKAQAEGMKLTIDRGEFFRALTHAAAIRRGDKAEAEMLLDRVFASDATVSEWIQRGRYGAKGRAVTEPARKAA